MIWVGFRRRVKLTSFRTLVLRHRPLAVLCVFFLVITICALAVYAASEAAQRRAKNRADDLIANFLVSSLYDLEALHLDTVDSLLPIIQPGTNTMLHSTVPFVVPFDVDSMPEKFNDGLIGEWNDAETVVSYLIYIVMDAEGDLTFLNDAGEAIGSLSAAENYDPLWLVKLRYPDLEDRGYTKAEIEYFTASLHANRIATQILLVPSDSLYTYLLAEEEAASSASALLGGGGGQMMMSMGSGEASISSIAQDTNGVTLTFTSTYSSATAWDLFTTLDLVTQPTWDLLKADIVITNAVTTTWLDENETEEHLFYALGTAEDCDGDSVRDGLEAFVYHTHIEDVTEGLVAWWKFDEERGIIAADQVNTNHGAIYGTTASASQFGPVGRAMAFAGPDDPDGDLDYIEVPDSDSLDVDTNITLTAWIYPQASNSTRKSIIQKGAAYYLTLKNGKLQFWWYGLTNEAWHVAQSAVPTEAWSHVAATYDGSEVRLYVNSSNVLAQGNAGTGDANNSVLGIGDGIGDDRHFPGLIDDARIYSIALTSNQIYSLYELGSDQDGDRVSLATESFYFTDPTDADTDDDGLDDFAEISYYLTDPTESNEFANISGSVTYKGSSTGQTIVIASPTRFGWLTNSSVTLMEPGSFTITNVPVQSNCWLKVFRDFNSNAVWDASDNIGLFTNNPVQVTSSGLTGISMHAEKIKGMRVDPGLSYYTGTTAGNVALVVSNAVKYGVNTLFVKAHSSFYGTFWRTEDPYLEREGSHGEQNFLSQIVVRAHAEGIKVIAALWEINNFESVYEVGETNASVEAWRAKHPDGSDIFVAGKKYMLSPYNTNYLNWMDGVVSEILDLGVDGIEVTESNCGASGTNATFDAAANLAFSNRYPGLVLLDGTDWIQPWRELRTETLTSNLYGRVAALVHARTNRALECHMVYTWTAENDAGPNRGKLVSSRIVADNDGLSFDRILDLPEFSRPDFVSPELMWQQWATNATDDEDFTPEWTEYASTTIVLRVRSRSVPIVHVEIDDIGDAGIIPTLPQIETAFGLAISNAPGIDFYDHNWAYTNIYDDPPYDAGLVISNVYHGSP